MGEQFRRGRPQPLEEREVAETEEEKEEEREKKKKEKQETYPEETTVLAYGALYSDH
jgi:CO dehydrogenase/acetyl-CoA synthase beta subunit